MPYLPKPPGVVTSAGVLLILYAALMLFGGVCGGVMLAMNDPNDALLAEEVPGYQIVQIFSTVSNVVIGVIMVVAGVCLFQLIPVARLVGYFACAYELVVSIALGLYNLILVIPATERMLAVQAQNAQGADLEGFIRGAMWASVILGILLPLAFCAPVIYLLSLPLARAAFTGEFQGDPPPRDRRPRYEDYDDDEYRPPPTSRPPDTGIQDRSS